MTGGKEEKSILEAFYGLMVLGSAIVSSKMVVLWSYAYSKGKGRERKGEGEGEGGRGKEREGGGERASEMFVVYIGGCFTCACIRLTAYQTYSTE